jgi:hypothetical protein
VCCCRALLPCAAAGPSSATPCRRPHPAAQKFIEDCGAGAKVDGPLNFKGGKYMVLLVPSK